jgi:hypothetical protein
MFATTTSTPAFGGRQQHADYYTAVFKIVDRLKPTATLRSMAAVLNEAGLSTPSGLAWNRQRLSNFTRTTQRIGATNN